MSIIIYWLCGIVGLSPYTLLAVAPLWALLGGICFYLVALKTKSPQVMLIFCLIQALNGLSALTIIAELVSGFIIFVLCRAGALEKPKLLRLAYIIFTVAFALANTIIPFLFFAKQTVENLSASAGTEYMDIAQKVATAPVLGLVLLAVIIAAYRVEV